MYCRTRYLCVLIAFVCLLTAAGLVSARTLEVGPDGKIGYPTIQAAVDAARDGDTIMISPGTYRGSGNCDIDLRRKALTLQGTDPTDADVVVATVIDCQGTASDPHRGFYAVDFSGEISGLTIANGLAAAGGAVYCVDSALVLSHCHLLDNGTLPGDAKTTAGGGAGGGVYCANSALDIVDCLISGNTTGAGLDSRDAQGGSGGDGAGVFAVDSAVHVADSTIADNTTGAGGSGSDGGPGGRGAGIYAVRVAIERCIVEGNTAGAGGDSTDAFKGAGGQGGSGGGLFGENSVEVTNSLFVGNRSGRGGSGASAGADGQGAGLWCAYGLIDHCTVADNTALQLKASVFGDPSLGAGLWCSPDTVVANSILWGNTPDQIAGQSCDNVAHCDIEGDLCLENKGNLSADPLFVAAGAWVDARDSRVTLTATNAEAVWAGGDYRLASTSPCIDAGDADVVGATGDADLDGQPRSAGAAVDMGAYETQGLMAIYRFVSPVTGRYFYTPLEAEKDRLIEEFSHVWTFEGIAYYAYATPSDTALMPVYRFWSTRTGGHFWTISEAERDNLIGRYSDVWTYEGLAFYAYPAGSQPAGAKPVYRFWSATLDAHFYTIDEAEKQELIDRHRDTWTYETIAWYAFDAPQTDDDTPDTPDVVAGTYDLTAQGNAMTCTLELKAYLDGQEARLSNSTMTFAPASARMEMALDFEALTAEMNEVHLETQIQSISSTASEIGGTIALPFDLYLYGYFDTLMARGPYAIDPDTRSFPSNAFGDSSGNEEVCTFVGSASVEGEKFDMSLEVTPTNFETGLSATLSSLGASGRLDVNMNETFRWTRSGQEDLLLQADVRGHLLQVYVTSVQVRTTGLWVGKTPQSDAKK